MEAELKKNMGAEGAEVELVPSSGGVFEVTVDDRLIFSKKKLGRFPDEGEIVSNLN